MQWNGEMGMAMAEWKGGDTWKRERGKREATELAYEVTYITVEAEDGLAMAMAMAATTTTMAMAASTPEPLPTRH